MLGTRLAIRVRGKRRVAVIGAAVVMAAGLATAVAQVAGAQPQPSISDVQAKINTLTGQFDKANQQYDQVAQQLTAAKTRLKQVNKQLARDEARYEASRKLVVQIAASTYEDSGSTSLAGLLTTNDPAKVLTQASLLLQLTGTRNLQAKAFLADATQLASVQQEQQRTESGIAGPRREAHPHQGPHRQAAVGPEEHPQHAHRAAGDAGAAGHGHQRRR